MGTDQRMSRYEVQVWAEGSDGPVVTAFDALDDARAELQRALREPAGGGRFRVDVVNPDGIVIESAER
jgi:hypothetical protein